MNALVAVSPRITLGELLQAQGPAAHASLLVLLATPCVLSLPGITTLLCIGLASVGAALWRGQPTCVLPARVESLALARSTALRIGRISARLHAWAHAIGRPRWTSATQLRPRSWPALLVWAMALLIWLPIPFGNVLPAMAIALLGLGLAARDGAMAFGAAVLAVLALVTTAVLGWGALAWLSSAWPLVGA